MRLVKADLHFHPGQPTSKDPKYSFNQVVDSARERLGPGGILGIIDFEGFPWFEALLPNSTYRTIPLDGGVYVPDKDILLLKGQEVMAKEGHLLLLCLSNNVFLQDNRPLSETLFKAKKLNSIIGADHPSYVDGLEKTLRGRHTLIKYFDFVETYNSQADLYLPLLTPFEANKKAKTFFDYAKNFNHRVGFLQNSDGRFLKDIGRSNTILTMPDSYDSLTGKGRLKDVLLNGIRHGQQGDATGSKISSLYHIASILLADGVWKTFSRTFKK